MNDIENFFRNRHLNTEPTKREQVVIGLAVEGWSNKAIASKLGIDTKTVEHHLNSIYGKLEDIGVDFADKHRRVYLTILYLRHSIGNEAKP